MNFAPETAGLALDTVQQRPRKQVPTWALFVMEHAHIERLAGMSAGSYAREPERVYRTMQYKIGACLVDQYIPENPLTMGAHGYEKKERGATTGAHSIVRDGIEINSPESVIEHMEKFVFPACQKAIDEFDEDARVREILEKEQAVQNQLGPSILKTGYNFIRFPITLYGAYGYANYFMAYALFPDVMERHFAIQADLAVLHNRAAARAYREGNLPPLYRLDHDLADSRGTLVDIRSLDRIWFPHFARSIEPMTKTNVRMIWHCDGNLMEMVPRLIESGVRGFQGFQYEAGMDYERICKMKTREGEELIIFGGVSVTDTLPNKKPEDVRREIRWLVENGPRTGLFLGGSSSITPGVPWENMQALVEGLNYYRTHGRD